jgi:hypothetical protein
MKKLMTSQRRLALLLAVALNQFGTVLAQDAESSSSPAGLAMLVLFLGIAGMIGVFVIRWSQSSREDENSS